MFSNPEKNIEQFGLLPGMKVADLGVGSGFYTLAAARAVGEKGRVFAVDIQQDLLAKVKNQARNAHLYNIEIIWGDLERMGGTKIRDMSVDGVVLSNVLFQIEHKSDLAKEVRRILKPKGQVLLVDWSDSFGGMGPKPVDIIPQEAAKELFLQGGFEYVRSITAGDHHYGMILAKK